MQNKFIAITNAYETKKVADNRDTIAVIKDSVPSDIKDVLLDIQRNLDVGFDLSYEIVSEACDILSEMGIEKINTDETDFFAEADSRANVYTAVQLSYLNLHNESEISELMKDESITSIAQACSIWHSHKVAEACQALTDYIIN